MRIVIVGGGPAGLYFALLAKQANPAHQIDLYERNRADDTFGFGVVFSDETLGEFMSADPATYQEIVDNFAYWDQIDVHAAGQVVRSGGHGFCGIARKRLLEILQRRAAALGVRLHFQQEAAPDLAAFAGADLIVAADGINSAVRERFADVFRPSLDWRHNRFVWLGTTKPLDTFTFIFRENEHGLFQVHAYRFDGSTSTWIVETSDETWRRAGLDRASEAETVAYCEKLFAPDLAGHPLLLNRSLWRQFPTVRCEHWVHRNIVLLGDAAHTAHFSIGSGTKLAMEDAIALNHAVASFSDVRQALAAYETSRKDEVGRLQHAAQVSLEWFEATPRYRGVEPIQLAMSLLSRSKRITYDNLRLRDPGFVAGVDRWFAEAVRKQGLAVPEPAPPPMFTPFRLRGMTVANRIMVSPMCQYSAEDGMPGDWHLVHLGSRAIGGAGLVVSEMTDVSPDARITPGCTGLWSEAHATAWKRIVDFVHANSSARFGVQLAHAGRKGATCLPWAGGYDRPLPEDAWPIVSASALPYYPDSQVPKAMDRADMVRVRDDFARAARLAELAGFDMIELHMAHGYLLASFISPLTNRRDDEFGGSVDNRMRFPLEVFDAVRAVWPAHKPISVRVSATDWQEPGGLTAGDSVAVARLLKAHGCDVIDVSAGQTTPDARPVYGRMFQTPFADRIRHEAGVATIAIGAITSADQANTILAAGRADLVALARPHLADPYFTLRAAAHYGVKTNAWPKQYQPGRDQAYSLARRANEEAAEQASAAKTRLPARQRKAAE
ncbi:MAG TPA: bifunctional salicylyl-CoA 5-hydroxylase/oxidoreductase [Candidatus Cybelea sp.]|nr:bifunctional salicylyl-CoA 5-hydroxylase/oxidoreductase [Candidatus Cybelea sp.]